MISESDDSLVLLAALAHRQGADDLARGLLGSVGVERQPATIAYATDLATRLGVLEDLQERRRQVVVRMQGPAFAASWDRSLAAVRAELDRRGWR